MRSNADSTPRRRRLPPRRASLRREGLRPRDRLSCARARERRRPADARGLSRRRRGHRHLLARPRGTERTVPHGPTHAAAQFAPCLLSDLANRSTLRPDRRVPCYCYLCTQSNDGTRPLHLRGAHARPGHGSRRSLPRMRLRNLIEEATLADEVGLDVFASASITGPTSPSRRRPSRSPP